MLLEKLVWNVVVLIICLLIASLFWMHPCLHLCLCLMYLFHQCICLLCHIRILLHILLICHLLTILIILHLACRKCHIACLNNVLVESVINPMFQLSTPNLKVDSQSPKSSGGESVKSRKKANKAGPKETWVPKSTWFDFIVCRETERIYGTWIVDVQDTWLVILPCSQSLRRELALV